jgi:starch-binding outer membrane protein, SusD/RagB family
MRYTHIKTAVIFLTVSVLSGSCKKFLDIDPPPDKIQTPQIFENNASAVSATTGLFSKMSQTSLNMMSGGTTLFAGVAADEIFNSTTTVAAEAFRLNSLLPNNSTVRSTFWNGPYGFIYHANAVLEGLARSNALSDSIKNQLRGEMLVARSLVYFYLVNFFGDVPFIESTAYEANSAIARTPVAEIYQRLVTDLEEAQILLKAGYPSANRVRPNRWTATALLARIYLYTGEFVKAESSSNAVIISGMYNLSLLASVFTSISSNETIWQLMRDLGNTFEGSTFIPSSATVKPAYPLTSYLLSAFETGDMRKTTGANGWLGKNTVSGIDYYYPNKYRQRTLVTGASPTEYLIVFRLAEQYLIRAKARARQNNLTGAIQDINMIRTRAGLGNLSVSLTQAQVIAAIEQERRVELFAEWGHRWFDLKRTGRADIVLGPVKSPNWQSTDVLFPIPHEEINLNIHLTQNPGY